MQALSFRCTGCGNCCRSLRVAVTAEDVARLAAATGESPGNLVDWLAPEAVDMTGEPGSFVELSEGRRLMVLAQHAGACRLLDAQDRCSQYGARPLDCRAFPFDFARTSSRGAPRRLRLLPLSNCDHDRDGSHDRAALEALDSSRWQALGDYQADVERWNRLARQRRRLGHRVGSAGAFLLFALDRVAHRPASHRGSSSSSSQRRSISGSA